jgi:hypothetical protein
MANATTADTGNPPPDLQLRRLRVAQDGTVSGLTGTGADQGLARRLPRRRIRRSAHRAALGASPLMRVRYRSFMGRTPPRTSRTPSGHPAAAASPRPRCPAV